MTDADVKRGKFIIAKWAACTCCECRAPMDPCSCPEDRIVWNEMQQTYDILPERPLTPKEKAKRRKLKELKHATR